jgi:HTH-type transcriptional repressor of NAD biosynthesis genes
MAAFDDRAGAGTCRRGGTGVTTGVVIGKFSPPHAGHSYLINTARSQVDHLTVIVCERDDQPVDGATRAAWIREIHPDVTVIVTADDIADDRGDETSQAWAERTVSLLGIAPDVVFTSEAYGEAYARYMGSRHVSVDPGREVFPVSGTAVRADPAAHWQFLQACVRAHYVQRVCVIGAESTGTSTLASSLAWHYGTECVAEYGRLFCEERVAASGPLEWRTEDFETIAQCQQANEDAAARRSGPLLICDTDALATAIWHERYLGCRSPAVDELAASRRHAMYILTGDDIPWVQRRYPGRRARPGLDDRALPGCAVEPDRAMARSDGHTGRAPNRGDDSHRCAHRRITVAAYPPMMHDLTPPIPRSYWVSPHLLAGAYPGAPDRQEAREKVAALIGAGVTQFLDLTDERDGLLPYEKLLTEVAPGGGVVRKAVPVQDLTAPPAEVVRQALDLIDEETARGGVTYVHCWGGIGRTGSIASRCCAELMVSTSDQPTRGDARTTGRTA